MSCRNSAVRIVSFGLLASYSMLFTSGCRQVHGTQSMQASAPGFGVEGRTLSASRNLADPNRPFSVSAAKPKLTTREPLLDINGVPTCEPAQLNLFESRAQSTGAHHTLRLTLANTGAACRLGGFPAITLIGSDGSVLGGIRIRKVSSHSMAASLAPPAAEQPAIQQESVTDTPSPLVLLASKGQAAFELGWTSGSNCLQASQIAVAAPGSTKPILVSRTLAVCEDQVLITAVVDADSN